VKKEVFYNMFTRTEQNTYLISCSIVCLSVAKSFTKNRAISGCKTDKVPNVLRLHNQLSSFNTTG
ncbi:hypothetical protein RCM74_05555, partial [Escherichia coli]|nr:hypothetical protein [Escherichia coli]